MPDGDGPDAEVLQHDHRISGGYFAQDIFEARGELVGNDSVLSRRGEHLDLQAAAACGNVNLGDEILRRDLDAGVTQSGRKRCGSALVFVLRQERHIRQLDVRDQPGWPRVVQLHRLWNDEGAAARERCRKKNARGEAGVAQKARQRGHYLIHKYQMRIATTTTAAMVHPLLLAPAGRELISPLSAWTSLSLIEATRSRATCGSRPCDWSWLTTSVRSRTASPAARSSCAEPEAAS